MSTPRAVLIRALRRTTILADAQLQGMEIIPPEDDADLKRIEHLLELLDNEDDASAAAKAKPVSGTPRRRPVKITLTPEEQRAVLGVSTDDVVKHAKKIAYKCVTCKDTKKEARARRDGVMVNTGKPCPDCLPVWTAAFDPRTRDHVAPDLLLSGPSAQRIINDLVYIRQMPHQLPRGCFNDEGRRVEPSSIEVKDGFVIYREGNLLHSGSLTRFRGYINGTRTGLSRWSRSAVRAIVAHHASLGLTDREQRLVDTAINGVVMLARENRDRNRVPVPDTAPDEESRMVLDGVTLRPGDRLTDDQRATIRRLAQQGHTVAVLIRNQEPVIPTPGSRNRPSTRPIPTDGLEDTPRDDPSRWSCLPRPPLQRAIRLDEHGFIPGDPLTSGSLDAFIEQIDMPAARRAARYVDDDDDDAISRVVNINDIMRLLMFNPKGGVMSQGITYRLGEFIPTDVRARLGDFIQRTQRATAAHPVGSARRPTAPRRIKAELAERFLEYAQPLPPAQVIIGGHLVSRPPQMSAKITHERLYRDYYKLGTTSGPYGVEIMRVGDVLNTRQRDMLRARLHRLTARCRTSEERRAVDIIADILRVDEERG